MTTKTSILPTNLNNKLECRHFLHIDLPMQNTFKESVWDQTIFQIETKDKSHSPVKAKVRDLIRIPLNQVRSHLTWPSHGMDSAAFKKLVLSQHKGLSGESVLAVYFFERI